MVPLFDALGTLSDCRLLLLPDGHLDRLRITSHLSAVAESIPMNYQNYIIANGRLRAEALRSIILQHARQFGSIRCRQTISFATPTCFNLRLAFCPKFLKDGDSVAIGRRSEDKSELVAVGVAQWQAVGKLAGRLMHFQPSYLVRLPASRAHKRLWVRFDCFDVIADASDMLGSNEPATPERKRPAAGNIYDVPPLVSTCKKRLLDDEQLKALPGDSRGSTDRK